MAILILGATVLTVTVVWAARTSGGSWLVYFESLASTAAKPADAPVATVRDLPGRQAGESQPEVDRIVAVSGRSYPQAGVLS